VPRSFTLGGYKTALADPLYKPAKEGWDYLIRHGVSESEVFETVKLAILNDLESLRKAYQRTRISPRQVRSLAGQLRKHAEALEKVIVQYPDLLPAFLTSDRRSIESRFIRVFLNTIADRLSACRAKDSADGEATVCKGRVATGPNIPAGLSVLSLFNRAAADFYAPETVVRFNSPSAELPPSPVAKKRYAQAAALLNLACQLTGRPLIFSSDYLQKIEEVRSLEGSLPAS